MKTALEVLNDVKERVTERYNAAYQAWLEKLTTLSLAALTLLVSLQSTYVPQSPRGGWLLSGTWGLLALAVLAGLLAQFGEAQAHREFQLRVRDALSEDLNKRHSAGLPLPAAQEWIAAIERIPYTRPRLYCAAAATAAGSLALAVICLTAFATWNL